MDDFKNKIYSEEYLANEAEFDAKLNAIELKYQFWFSERENMISVEKPDRLHNYWITYRTGNNLSFKVQDELPFEIRQECLQAFNDVYNKA